MPPNAEPDYPHLHVKMCLPDGGSIMMTWPASQAFPRWAEGIHIMGHDFMVNHVCWSFEEEDGPHLPLVRLYLTDQDDWDDDMWPAPPGTDGTKHPTVGDIDVNPDIKV